MLSRLHLATNCFSMMEVNTLKKDNKELGKKHTKGGYFTYLEAKEEGHKMKEVRRDI